MYNLKNWYWLASSGRIYSSKKQAITTEEDKDYIAWKDGGNLATPWPNNEHGIESDQALAEVLSVYNLSLYPETLDELKTNLKNKIDLQAENERLKYITSGVGQSLTYLEKVNQAASYSKAYVAHLSDPSNNKTPNTNEYLLLQASIGIDGDTLAEVAENITWTYALWEKVGAAIETIRLQAKAAIDKTKTAKEAQTIFDTIKWPTP